MFILPNAIPIKFPMAFFIVIENKVLKFAWKQEKYPNSQSNSEEAKQKILGVAYFLI
jgi:hypothetical protein